MQLDENFLKNLSKDKSKKRESGKDNIVIKSSMYPFSKENLSYIESLTTFEIALLMLDKLHQINSKKNKLLVKGTWKYSKGDIIMVHLGENYGNELSYYHPAIVFCNLYDSILIIPCSSTIPKDPNIIVGEQCDGFANKTAILLNKIRVIDKKRVSRNKNGGIVGKLSLTKFDEIRDKLISIYFSGTERYIEKIKNGIDELKKEKEIQNKELIEAKILIEKLEQQLKKLTIEK